MGFKIIINIFLLLFFMLEICNGILTLPGSLVKTNEQHPLSWDRLPELTDTNSRTFLGSDQRNIDSDAFLDLNQQNINSQAISSENQLLGLPRNALVISYVRTIINNIFVYINGLASSLIPVIGNLATFTQQNIVSPFLTLFNTLAALTLIQGYEPLYIAVLLIQTLLNVSNQTLASGSVLFSNGTSIVTTGVQSIIDNIFNFILSILA